MGGFKISPHYNYTYYVDPIIESSEN